MYDTNFIVKYHDIQEELDLILKKDNEVDHYQYSSQDILDICNKLYRDELCSVFYAEHIMDDKIDKGLKYIFELMLVNPDFKAVIDKIKALIHLKNKDYVKESINLETSELETAELETTELETADLETTELETAELETADLEMTELETLEIIFILFSENIFYLTHKCICQQITTEHIDNEIIKTLLKILSQILL